MSETAEKLAVTLLALAEADRLALANMLLDSLPPPPGVMTEDDPEFDAVLQRRREEMESGKVVGIPADEFFRTLGKKQGRSTGDES